MGTPHPIVGKRMYRKNGDSQQCGARDFSGMMSRSWMPEVKPVMKLFEQPAITILKARKTANISVQKKDDIVETTVKAACSLIPRQSHSSNVPHSSSAPGLSTTPRGVNKPQ